MAKPQNNQTLNCHSVYDYMTEKEQDVVYVIESQLTEMWRMKKVII